MNEPSATQGVKQLEEQHGKNIVLLVLLREYWARVLGIVVAIFTVGMVYQQFRTMEEMQGKQNERLDRMDQHMQAIDSNLTQISLTQTTIRENQTKTAADWEAIHAAADIVIKPRGGKGVK